MIRIEEASKIDLDQLAPLFDQYRVFYKQESDIQGAKSFLLERLKLNESEIFIAYFNNKAAGFIQLYSTFSSVSMQRSFVLNDLYVLATYRNKKIGEALLNRAKEFCIENNAKGLALETSTDNPAQKLYEKMGWVKDIDCFHYFWTSK